MQKLNPKTDSQTKNIVAENIEKLKDLFPEAFTEGKVDLDALKEIIGEFVDDREERYSFTWNGKSKARMLAQTPSTGTLRPCPKESVNWDTTQNIFIEGDNLEALKLLQKSYHKKVKMIYIDPPYNTGKEFIYPDKFQDNLDTYLRYTGQIDDEGFKMSANAETSGRYHTNWINMMYPRLKLAKNLLRDDGVIFISIDDNEVVNLRKICDEIYGEENFLAQIIWQKIHSTKNDAKYYSDTHEYILCYSKNIDLTQIKLLPRTETMDARFSNPDEDPRGSWASGDLVANEERTGGYFDIEGPTGKIFNVPKGKHWVYAEENLKRMIAENRIWFGKNGDAFPRLKRYLSEVQQGRKADTIWLSSEVGHNQESKREIKKIFDGFVYFDTPKPVRLISRCLALVVDNDDIILDFFAGSSTTAHALFDMNKQDNGNRKFILIQLPEACDKESEAFKAGYKTIADIGKERIRRVSDKIKNESPSYQGDLGFKVFKLDSTNVKPWEADFDTIERTIDDYITNIKHGRTEHDILYEILLKYGLNLTIPVEERSIDNRKVFVVGMGALVICLANDISLTTAEGIALLKKELQPELMRVVFKDTGFKNDVIKTNAMQILRQNGIDDVKSL